jgi:glutaryl-CoA dehydrogenase
MSLTDVMSLIDFDTLLTDEERLIQRTVREFVTARVRPNIADWFERGIAPRER